MIVFYFFMIRPQMKKAMTRRSSCESLERRRQRGDDGRYPRQNHQTGRNDRYWEMFDKSRLKFDRGAIVPDSAART